MSGLWSGAVMQPHQLHQLQQQQLQQQLMLGGHPGGNMGPIVGHQHQSPPGLGPLNMMIGPGPVGGQHGVSTTQLLEQSVREGERERTGV